MSKVIELTKQLVALPSITPEDAGCQHLLSERLRALEFTITDLPFGKVKNFWARRGDGAPLLVFAGHTDVVPTGPLDAWSSDPFKPEIRDGYLYGRGSADMKGSLAAMIIAVEEFIANNPTHQGSIGLLITSDEEGPAVDGTVKVIEYLQSQQQQIDYCLVGEPTSNKTFGDMLKIGRRGSLHGNLTIHGKQGHIAYPHLADNPIMRAAAAIAQLNEITWDEGNADFPPTSFQISNIHGGTGADNVIPGELTLQFNFRFAPVSEVDNLKKQVHQVLDKHQLKYSLDWRVSGKPYYTQDKKFITAVKQSIEKVADVSPEISTTGGTSDGRFIAPTGTAVVEFGPCNATIHQIDECVKTSELEALVKVYHELLHALV